MAAPSSWSDLVAAVDTNNNTTTYSATIDYGTR